MALYKGSEKLKLNSYTDEAIGTAYDGSYAITPGTDDISIPADTYMEQDLVITGDANFLEENIAKGVTILGKTGTAKGKAPNGTEWTQSNITDISINSICYGNGIWVAAGNSNSGLYYSTNGREWAQSNITDKTINCVYYANGIWVAGSSSNGLYYSTDGMTWTQSNITDISFRCVYNANNIWVACSGYIYYSTDGKTWSKSGESATYSNIYYGNNLWVATSYDEGIWYSEDGKIWSQSNKTTSSFNCVYYANGIWIAGGAVSAGIVYSTDGKTWVGSNRPYGAFYSFYYANGIWIAAGGNGNGLWYSLDGMNWTQSNITYYVKDVYYSNGIWIAGTGNNGILYSIDGITWMPSNITDVYTLCVHNENGIWEMGSGETSNGIYYSYTWEPITKLAGFFVSDESTYDFYKFEEEMTWGDFINSAYNDGHFEAYKSSGDTEDRVRYIPYENSSFNLLTKAGDNSTQIYISDTIKINKIYYYIN